jgi:YD repeat-containing protein
LQECYRRLTYLPDGEEFTIRDANGNTTTYSYDGWNRLTTTTFPDGTNEQLTPDENDNVTKRITRAGQALDYQYNALDWTVQKVSPSPSVTTTWSYLLDGGIDVLSDTATNSINYGYDSAGRLTSIDTLIPGFGAHRIVSYQLDANGNRTQLTWPARDGGDFVGYCYDSLNRMILAQDNATDCMSSPLATYAYDAQSHRTSVTYGNGANMSYPSYSLGGDLQTLTENFTGPANDNTFTYNYTPAHQTQSIAASNTAFLWQPPVNNSTSYTVNNLNQYPTIGAQTTGGSNCQGGSQGLSYDCNGNLTFDGIFTYTYDADNRLLTANKAGIAASYSYDPLGRRTKKSGTGVTTTYFLSDGTDEIAEYDSSKTITTRIIPGPAIDEPIAIVNVSTGAKEFFHVDKQGSVVAMSDGTGVLVEGPYLYDAYGDCFVGLTACGAAGESYRFTGRRFDLRPAVITIARVTTAPTTSAVGGFTDGSCRIHSGPQSLFVCWERSNGQK